MLNRNLNFQSKFHFTSLGCARNLVDSEVMMGILLRAGFELVSDRQEADFLVINTCGFLEASRQEGIDTIAEVFQEKKADAKVIVAGCMVQKHGRELKERFPKIHYFLGSGDVDKILDAIRSEAAGAHVSSARSYLEWGEVPRMLSTPKHYAYLKIAEGCRKRCAFCIIPAMKGPLKSKSEERVLHEFRSLLSQGVFEVILIAQDLGDYGKDRKEKGALARLLSQMLAIENDFWLRLLYLYPDEVDEDLIALMKSDPRICPYLDMPIQHISDPILKAMHRTTSQEEIVKTLQTLRREVPNISIRTSLMVGFPGEREEHFQELLQFVREFALDNAGIFKFSLEKEAHAARLPDQVPEEIKEERFERLALEQLQSVRRLSQKWVGRRLPALVEGVHPDSPFLFRARHQGQCPEVDGQIILNDSRGITAFGRLHEVKIAEAFDYDLIGHVVRPSAKAVQPAAKRLKSPRSGKLAVIQ